MNRSSPLDFPKIREKILPAGFILVHLRYISKTENRKEQEKQMADAAQGMFQSGEMRQEQTLTPQQLQSLDILYAPVLELQQKINQELADNPVLEIVEPTQEPDDLPPAREEKKTELGSERDDMEDELAKIVELAAEGYADPDEISLPSGFDQEDEDERRDYLFNSIADETSMQELLLQQLRYADTDPETARIAEFVIGGIDESGYLKTHPADIATGADCSLEAAEKAIRLVQGFDPPGIGARDLKECLLLQLEREGENSPELIDLVSNHLDEIARNKLPQLAKSLNIPLERLNEDIRKIRTLNPYPGNEIANSKPVYIVPEVSVERDGDEFKVVSDDNCIPHLRISKFYLKLLEDPNTPDDVKTYIKNKLTSGKGLMKCLDQRQKTIRRIADIIVSTQHDFLEKGVEYLKPMTMQQVADKLGLHETTISRAIANKYIRTPMGLFEFKFFFTGGFQSKGGDEISSRGVKEIIRDLIENENPASPLSDSKLVSLLKERGLDIARRTVAKYREELGIQSSHLRRNF